MPWEHPAQTDREAVDGPLEPDFIIRRLPQADDQPQEAISDMVSSGPIPGAVVHGPNGTERTDSSGGMLRYNSGKHRLTLIPASFGRYTAAVLEYGAIKYNANNWRKGGSWTSAIDSLQRHLDSFREGEDFDDESKLPHLAHLAFNVMILIEFFDRNLGQDDRFRYPGQLPGQQLPTRELKFAQPPKRTDDKFGAGPIPA